jgi:CubicO group peptidase (beta-lactamase class C family)
MGSSGRSSAAGVIEAAREEVRSRPAVHHVDLSSAADLARTFVADGALPSAVIGIADASGVLDVVAVPGPSTPGLETESLFFLASLTKPIVATAIMQLVDERRLDLHAPIQRYVPEFRGPGKDAVTAWHVLTHTSGIADVDAFALRRLRHGTASMLRRVCEAPLVFEPGTEYAYVSDSFYLLSTAIERLTGMPFPDALRRRVLGPVDALDVTFDPRDRRHRLVAVRNIGVDNRFVQRIVLRYLARTALPGGGLWGSAPALLRFGVSLLPESSGARPRILSQASIDEMTREHTVGILEIGADGSTREPHYGLGWGKTRVAGTLPSVVGTPVESRTVVPASYETFTHGGATGTRLWIDPVRELVFVFLTNQWGLADGPMYELLAEVYREWDATG